MTGSAASTTSTIIPCLRYRDAAAAIEWLCEAFGFEKHMVVPGEDGTIDHAQLTFGNGMIMLGSIRSETEWDRMILAPVGAERSETQTPYLIVADIEAHAAKAKAAGAEIVMDVEEQDYGGKLYVCRDPEGHIWNFGDYDPWAPAEG